MRRSFPLAALILVVAFPAAAEPWQFYGGGFSTAWQTQGHHGHNRDCWMFRVAPGETPGPDARVVPDCDLADFADANLDNGMGYRWGMEKPLYRASRFVLTRGWELSSIATEYNISQRDLAFYNLSATLALSGSIAGSQLGIRSGLGGAVTDDDFNGFSTFYEASLDVPIGQRISIRGSTRISTFARMFDGFRAQQVRTLTGIDGPSSGALRSHEASVMLVVSEGAVAPQRWEYATSVGLTFPGSGVGNHLGLASAPTRHLMALRSFDDVRVGLVWSTSAHESEVRSEFFGYPDNERSKTIDGFGIRWDRRVKNSGRLGLRYGGGLEISDWRDEHRLLIDENRQPIEGGVEAGLLFTVLAQYRLVGALVGQVSAEQLYWTGIGMPETRLMIGFAVTR